jgi:hypothetical protein
MKIYKEKLNEKDFEYYWDSNVKSWTVYTVDLDGFQIEYEAEYFPNKKQLLESYNFKF